jgi:predicted dehydrogenase
MLGFEVVSGSTGSTIDVSVDDLRTGRESADAVVLTCPAPGRVPIVADLLARDVVVVLESPFAATLADADELVELSAAHPGRLFCSSPLAHSRHVDAMLQRLTSLGPLSHLEARALEGPTKIAPDELERRDTGVLEELGSQPLTAILLLANAAGLGRPAAVRSTMSTAQGADSTGDAVLELSYGSPVPITARITASWSSGPSPLWDVQVSGTSGVVRAEFLPTARFEHNGSELTIPPAASTTDPNLAVVERLGYVEQMRQIGALTRRTDGTSLDVHVGRLTMEVLTAAARSAAHGGVTVSLPVDGVRDRSPRSWRLGR